MDVGREGVGVEGDGVTCEDEGVESVGMEGDGVTCEEVGVESEGGWCVTLLEITLVDSEEPVTS